MFRRRRLIPNLEHFTRNVPTVQPILLAISTMLSPCSRKVGISLKAARGTFRPICILSDPISQCRWCRITAQHCLCGSARRKDCSSSGRARPTKRDRFTRDELIFGACPPERLRRDIERAALNWRPPDGLSPILNPAIFSCTVGIGTNRPGRRPAELAGIAPRKSGRRRTAPAAMRW